jgi:hypothetical protein
MHASCCMHRMVTSLAIAALICAMTPVSVARPARAADGQHAQPFASQPSTSGVERVRLTTTETLVGTWTGRWQAAEGAANGSLGLVLTRVPGRETIIGQFTFVTGAISRTMRYDGRLDNGAVRFTLVDGGYIVLEAGGDAQRPMTADRLSGAWVDLRGALPAPHGSIELERAS